MKRRWLFVALLCALAPSCHSAESKRGSKNAPTFDGAKPCSESLATQLQSLGSAGRAVVVSTIADLCSRPPCAASLTDQLLLGDVVKTLPGPLPSCATAESAYLQIETVSGYKGFVAADALRALAPGDVAYRDSGPLVRVSSRLASIYAQPNVTVSKPIALVSVDIRLRVVAPVDDRWLKIVLPSGVSGFVQRGDVEELPAAAPPPSASCIIEHARLYAGTPYLWGGRSTLGIDCSGLVSNAFAACGVVPPRDAGPQHDWSKLTPVELSIAKLATGDLLFFGHPREGGGVKVTHVGIYVGDGRFVHASTHDRPVVQESALTDPHWAPIWVGARRYPFL